MRLAFASDFHGSEIHFRDFLALARKEGAEAAIVGGDLLPVARPFEQMLALQRQFARTALHDCLQHHSSKEGCPVYLSAGNNDWYAAMEVLQEIQQKEQKGSRVVSEAAILPLIESYSLVALPYVPPTPFRLKDFDRRDLAADPSPNQPDSVLYSLDGGLKEGEVASYLSERLSIEEELQKLSLASLESSKTIYVMHSPPHQTGLDRTSSGLDTGSRAIRNAIVEHQPLLTLHGHLHEAPSVVGFFSCRIGSTVLVNPGQKRDSLQAVMIEIGAETISLRHTSLGSVTYSL